MDKRLGRGLGSLLGGQEAETTQLQLDLTLLKPNPFQPRKSMDAAGLEELRDSIQNHGVLQPVVVRRHGPVEYELISGERRWRAARLAGLQHIPAVIREATDDEMLELALVENVQRRDLDPLERAKGFQSLMVDLNITQEEVAAKVGLKRSTVANHLRLLELPEKVQEAVARGIITMGHARALIAVKDPEDQLSMLSEVVRRDLSVRDIERAVRESAAKLERPGATPSQGVPPRTVAPWVTVLTRRMEERLGTHVSIQNGEGYRGRVVIEYHDREALDRIVQLLAPAETI